MRSTGRRRKKGGKGKGKKKAAAPSGYGAPRKPAPEGYFAATSTAAAFRIIARTASIFIANGGSGPTS